MIELIIDGDQWCAKQYGLDIMEGLCGFGYTQWEALREFASRVEEVGGI